MLKTFALERGNGPNYLSAWSPDGTYLLYSQVGEGDQGRVYVLDLAHGTQALVAEEALVGMHGRTAFHPAVAAPVWADAGTRILVSRPMPGQQQELVVVDLAGAELEQLGQYGRGPFFWSAEGGLVVVQRGAVSLSSKPGEPLAFPALATADQLATARVSTRQQLAFLADRQTLRMVDLANPTRQLSITPELLTPAIRDDEKDGAELKAPVWSAQGDKLAFWYHHGLYHELWIAEGAELERVASFDSVRGGHVAWSPDGTMLAMTISPTGTGSWAYVGLHMLYLDDLHIETLLEAGAYLNPSWDATGQRLAILDLNADGISIYTLN